MFFRCFTLSSDLFIILRGLWVVRTDSVGLPLLWLSCGLYWSVIVV